MKLRFMLPALWLAFAGCATGYNLENERVRVALEVAPGTLEAKAAVDVFTPEAAVVFPAFQNEPVVSLQCSGHLTAPAAALLDLGLDLETLIRWIQTARKTDDAQGAPETALEAPAPASE